MIPIIPLCQFQNAPTKFVVPCTNEILLPPFKIEIFYKERKREREREISIEVRLIN
jgi:hypothetical protein